MATLASLNEMALFGYEPTLRVAISDNPNFPSEEEAFDIAYENCIEIDEWQSYYVKFYSDTVPAFFTSFPYLTRTLLPNLYELNFRNFVGLSKLGNLQLKVRNKKISNKVYQSMLNDLADSYASLVFSFGTPVGEHYNKGTPGKDSYFVQYLFLNRFLLNQSPDVEAMGNIIVSDPHRKLESEIKSSTIDQCQHLTSGMIPYLLSGQMVNLAYAHPLTEKSLGQKLYNFTGNRLFPAHGLLERKYLTVDTHENRFVKYFLEYLIEKVEALKDSLIEKSGSYLNPEIADNLEVIKRKIKRSLSHNMWRDVGKLQVVPFNSQVLQRREGYRQLYSLYSLLQLTTRCDFLETDFSNLIEIKDLPTLYEYWCFLKIKELLDSIMDSARVSKIYHESPLEHKLITGLRIDYTSGVSLLFNTTYHGSSGVDKPGTELKAYIINGESYSHNLRPDIIIETETEKLIFDAKYKGKQAGFYGDDQEGTIKSWKDEDLDKMHCYRDAIIGVRGSFVLYPGRETTIYPYAGDPGLSNGVGAIALHPGIYNDNKSSGILFLKKIISSFLDMTIDKAS